MIQPNPDYIAPMHPLKRTTPYTSPGKMTIDSEIRWFVFPNVYLPNWAIEEIFFIIWILHKKAASNKIIAGDMMI